MVRIMMSTALLNKMTSFFDGYADDQIKCKLVSQKGIKAIFEVETELDAEACAAYCKALFKKQPGANALYFSIQPEGAF